MVVLRLVKREISYPKTEADGKTPLAGAKFELWNTTKTQLLREGKVDDNGQITFGNLPYGEYLLFETAAPKGFTISDDLVDGRRIAIDDKTSTENAAPLTIPNERNKVILQRRMNKEIQLSLMTISKQEHALS